MVTCTLVTVDDRSTQNSTEQGNFEVAIESYNTIIKLSSPNAKAHHLAQWGVGEIYLNNKDYDRAEIHLKRAAELEPEEADYQYLLGCTYTYVKEIDKALKHLRKALDLKPDHDVILGQLGWVVGYHRDPEEGIKLLKKSIGINPKNSKSLRDICMLYAKSQKWSEALVCIEEAMKHDSENPKIKKIKSDLEFFRSEYERLSAQKS